MPEAIQIIPNKYLKNCKNKKKNLIRWILTIQINFNFFLLIPNIVSFFSFRILCFTELDLQLLDPLPRELLNDINKENFEPPAQLDEDNVQEFRKKYDDALKYVKTSISGKKRVPPTEPYVKMLLLYDLLKRESKVLMLNKFVVSLFGIF
jgi:hypothetical protein